MEHNDYPNNMEMNHVSSNNNNIRQPNQSSSNNKCGACDICVFTTIFLCFCITMIGLGLTVTSLDHKKIMLCTDTHFQNNNGYYYNCIDIDGDNRVFQKILPLSETKLTNVNNESVKAYAKCDSDYIESFPCHNKLSSCKYCKGPEITAGIICLVIGGILFLGSFVLLMCSPYCLKKCGRQIDYTGIMYNDKSERHYSHK